MHKPVSYTHLDVYKRQVLELPLRGHDESASSTNPGVYKGLTNFTAELDSAMKDHLESATVFQGTSKIIQIDTLDCMLCVCREEIEKEIQASEFVTIKCEKTTDVTNHCQRVLVFRYERFWGFLSPEGKCAETLPKCIMNNINPLLHT